ncbi:putative hydrolase of the HAD superfamily [Dysgonomonas sp. PH5-45]|uniref:YjjG family noncanonical pyrimidine nucleotidase n=1 Tax=unclassified Dysgonomonas TaxID=2630389 RepID=UPI00247546CD|nr:MULTISPECIES: YjjG family noncanonical pyrimidine nucleotidase [unclassified Dysgonomonas]MDH6356029.1 putative hydrolase of the HAD superfamily [Dysgonomonas sp. PH5-45]MDH6388930.1 putative hydrolase of the HAD superfamily [Dysgonomonas sp. PH5-37]
MKRYKTLFFDLDDTLWDTATNSKDAMMEVFLQFGLNQFYSSFNEFYAIYSKHNSNLWSLYNNAKITKKELKDKRFEILMPLNAFNKTEIDTIADTFMHTVSLKKKLVHGAIDILGRLKEKYDLHILSNGFTEIQHIKMENSGLSPYFGEVILSDKVGVNKPDRKIFEYALQKTNSTKDTTLMIGDAFHSDIVGAYNSGIDQVWFNPQQIQPEGFEPTYQITRLEELFGIL